MVLRTTSKHLKEIWSIVLWGDNGLVGLSLWAFGMRILERYTTKSSLLGSSKWVDYPQSSATGAKYSVSPFIDQPERTYPSHFSWRFQRLRDLGHSRIPCSAIRQGAQVFLWSRCRPKGLQRGAAVALLHCKFYYYTMTTNLISIYSLPIAWWCRTDARPGKPFQPLCTWEDVSNLWRHIMRDYLNFGQQSLCHQPVFEWDEALVLCPRVAAL